MGRGRLDQVGPAVGALAQVGHDLAQPGPAELSGQQQRQLVAELVVGTHGSPPSLVTSSASRLIPRAILALTVPSGTPSAAAISTWVCPPK